MLYIQPGKPNQNAYVERYNRTVRHEWLDMHTFESIEQAQLLATQWLWRYNNERPNSAIGGVPPRWLLDKVAQSLGKIPIKNGGITCSADDVPETRTIGHRLHETYFFKCETIYLYFIEVFQGIRNYVALNLKRNSERTWRIFGCFARSKEHYAKWVFYVIYQ